LYPDEFGYNEDGTLDQSRNYAYHNKQWEIKNLTKCRGWCGDSTTDQAEADGRCAGNLKCFLRTGTEWVPGCVGVGKEGWGYCYDAEQWAGVQLTAADKTANSGYDPTNLALTECQGWCGNYTADGSYQDPDAFCVDGLICHIASAISVFSTGKPGVPGCSGIGDYNRGHPYGFCIDPQWDPDQFKSSEISFVEHESSAGCAEDGQNALTEVRRLDER
jgi:hypothetical protein